MRQDTLRQGEDGTRLPLVEVCVTAQHDQLRIGDVDADRLKWWPSTPTLWSIATGTAAEKRLMKINSETRESASDLRFLGSGAKGTRTPDPLLAKQVLFQLSYSPVVGSPRLPGRSVRPSPWRLRSRRR